MKHLSKFSFFLLSILSMTVFVSCDDDDDTTTPPVNTTPKMTAQEFVTQAAASDTLEILSGMMTDTLAMHAQVKSFGDMLVIDHTKSSMQLKNIALAKKLTKPKTIPAEKQAIITRLASKRQHPFDVDFAQVQVEAHTQAVALFERANNEVQDDSIKAFTTRMLPVLRMHLQHAQTLKTTVGQ